MKKLLLIGLCIGSLALAGCVEVLDKDGMERDIDDIPEGGGERITVVTEMCEKEGGKIEEWYEGGETQNVCFYPDESFCYLEELASENCHKGDIWYDDEDVVYDYSPEGQTNGKPIEESFCDYNNGIISENEYGDRFCTFPDGGYYELKVFKEVGEMPALRGPDEPYCSDYEDIVCGIDGVSYVNECWMKSTGIEKDPNAKFVDGKCVSE